MGGEASNDAKSLECSQCCWAASGGARGAKAEIHLAAESAVRRRRNCPDRLSAAGYAPETDVGRCSATF